MEDDDDLDDDLLAQLDTMVTRQLQQRGQVRRSPRDDTSANPWLLQLSSAGRVMG